MNLSNLTAPGKNKKRARVGRGESSGLGKTCGKGHKGQKSRSGGTVSPGFEGGQMPLQRRLPKKGFNNPFKIRYHIVNIKNLVVLDPATTITSEVLRDKGIVRGRGPIKLLSGGEVSAAYNVRVDRVSRSAAAKIEASGGTVED